MSDVSRNPSFHLSRPPHKLCNKQVLLKNKPTKKIGRSRSKNSGSSNLMMSNSSKPSTFSNTTTINKPLKVVHISNPKKFQVNAAEFRALVQGLTGRDAVVEWPDEGNHHQPVAAASVAVVAEDYGSANSSDDQVRHHQDEEAVNLSGCFGQSDLYQLSFDYFGAYLSDEHVDVMEDFRALIEGDDQSLLH